MRAETGAISDSPPPASPVPERLQAEIDLSRSKILNAIGDARDITFIRTYGNIGDDLIHAGFRKLLAGIEYKEVSILELHDVRGELGIISGSGGWCKPHHSMVRYLHDAEKRFERLIVLPSTYDPSVKTVRDALQNSRALFFAREKKSYELIRDLCRAELALDGAFYFDYSPYRIRGGGGKGVLQTYRTDSERVPAVIPRDNIDISMTCSTLDEWLWTIARHELVKSDRAHVVIAAALLGKDVRYRPSNYHKIPGLVEWLDGLPVYRDEEPGPEALKDYLMKFSRESLKTLPDDFFEKHREIETTIIILSHGRVDQTLKVVASIREHVRVPCRILLIDNNSDSGTQQRLKELAAGNDLIDLELLDENLGCSGGRAYAIGRVSTKYVFLLDNDEVVFDGTLEHLIDSLERSPDSPAATGKIIFPDGSIHVFGGTLEPHHGLLHQELYGMGRRYDDPLGDESICNFVPGGMTLYRREFFDLYPYDREMRYYYEDVDWCYRLMKDGKASFCRNPRSVSIHYHESKTPADSDPVEERRRWSMRFISSMAYFYQLHGLIIPNLFSFMPDLGDRRDKTRLHSARLLLEMVNSFGDEEILRRWNAGELEPLFFRPPEPTLPDRIKSAYDYVRIRIIWRWVDLTWKIKRFVARF